MMSEQPRRYRRKPYTTMALKVTEPTVVHIDKVAEVVTPGAYIFFVDGKPAGFAQGGYFESLYELDE